MEGRKEWREGGDGERKETRKESDRDEEAAEEREMQKSQDLILSKPVVWILSLTRTPIRYQYHPFPVKTSHIEFPRKIVGGGR